MGMTPEGRVKARVKRMLDELGAYYFMPAANGYGRAGIPDIIVCLRGRFVAIECKAGKGKTTALQNRELAAIETHGGDTFIANEDNVDTIREELLCLKQIA